MQNVISMLSSSTLPLHVSELVWVVKRGGSLSLCCTKFKEQARTPCALGAGFLNRQKYIILV
jgi:hypothetical protein